MKLSSFLEEEEFLPNISCKGKIKHNVNPTYHYKSKSGNGLDLDSIFQTLGPLGQSLGPIFQGSIVLCWQIYAKNPVRCQYFGSYGRLYQHTCVYLR